MLYRKLSIAFCAELTFPESSAVPILESSVSKELALKLLDAVFDERSERSEEESSEGPSRLVTAS